MNNDISKHRDKNIERLIEQVKEKDAEIQSYKALNSIQADMLTKKDVEIQKLKDESNRISRDYISIYQENKALEEKLRAASAAMKDAWNKLECHISGCSHKTRSVNSSTCSAHKLILAALEKLAQADGEEDKQ